MAVPFRIRRAEWVAGAFVVLAAVVLIVALLTIARARGSFVEQHRYGATLSDGHGLAAGASVEMLGIEVGQVERIDITPDNRVHVELVVDADFADRIRADSVVRVKMSLGLQTMLGGVALVVTPGSKDEPVVEVGSELAVVEPNSVADLLPTIGDDIILRDLEAIVANTRVLTDQLAQPQSEVGQLLANVSLLVASLQKGEGTVGKLLTDDADLYRELTSTLQRVEGTLKKAEGLMGKGGKLIDKSDELVGSGEELLSKTEDVIGDASGAFKKMDPVMTDAGKAFGSMGESMALFSDATKDLAEVLEKLDRVVDDLGDITRATKKVFPIRRHLDDKNRGAVVDGPTR